MGRILKAIKSSFAAFVSEFHEHIDPSVAYEGHSQTVDRIAAVAVAGAAAILYCIPSDLGALKPVASALMALSAKLWTGKESSAHTL